MTLFHGKQNFFVFAATYGFHKPYNSFCLFVLKSFATVFAHLHDFEMCKLFCDCDQVWSGNKKGSRNSKQPRNITGVTMLTERQCWPLKMLLKKLHRGDIFSHCSVFSVINSQWGELPTNWWGYKNVFPTSSKSPQLFQQRQTVSQGGYGGQEHIKLLKLLTQILLKLAHLVPSSFALPFSSNTRIKSKFPCM